MAKNYRGWKKKRPKQKYSILGLAGAGIMAYNVYNQYKTNEANVTGAGKDYAILALTGIRQGYAAPVGADYGFDFKPLIPTYAPLIVGSLISKVAGRLGVNRMFKGLPIKL